jgi:hypothetical protein
MSPAAGAVPAPVVEEPPKLVAMSGAGKSSKPVAQTVKLDHRLFVRLKNHSANVRLSHQAIFVAALQDYLDRNGG